ncbi:hypothetical protein MBLNU230_g3755t1 [Neophaeotheca triangularis]
MASQIPWKDIKALSFDIFGTLIDWESGIYTAAKASALGPHLTGSRKEVLQGIGRHDVAVQRENPTMKQSGVIALGLKCYAAELGLVENGLVSQETVDAAAREYGSKIGEYPAFEDTKEAMARLDKLGFKLVPLTNVDNDSFAGTMAGPLKDVKFDAIYTAEDVGSYKPDLRNFHYLLEHLKGDLGVEKEQLCHVAQSLLHDHTPAKAMGIRSVFVDRKGAIGGEVEEGQDEKYGFKFRVESLAELAGIIEKELGVA